MRNKNLTCSLAAALVCAAGASNLRAGDSDYNPFTVGLDAGTTGVGGSGSWRFADHFGVRGGFDYLKYSRSATIQGVQYDATLRLQSQPVTFDLYPTTDSSFHVSLGAAFNQNLLTGTGVSTTGSYTLNGQTFPAANVGTLNLNVSQQPIDPYLSIGGNFFSIGHGKHVSLGCEFGAFYTGKSKTSLSRSGGIADPNIDAALAAEQDKVKSYADKAIIWPVLKLELNFSF